MRCFIGIDLGSTTTKAVVINERREVLGRGITNSRSNYDTAAAVAKQEALVSARFELFRQALAASGALNGKLDEFIGQLERDFRLEQFLEQLADLEATCQRNAAGARFGDSAGRVAQALTELFRRLRDDSPALFIPNAKRKSDFFRDIAGAQYLALGEAVAKDAGVRYDMLLNVFDRSIIEVENRDYGGAISRNLLAAMDRALKAMPEAAARSDRIRAPIQGVLDIGGQDTKAIQVDPHGIVESFQMNDRCAAGCGRYLGYIADEMNMGLHELGPMAMKSTKTIKINSTCTVFAGAELRDRLALGDKREDIMAGLHRAIVLRAMSILARSGGIRNEFTFTGGVAKNEAAVKALKALVSENYGALTLNINPDSIYTGALGGATFAWRAVVEEGRTAEAKAK